MTIQNESACYIAPYDDRQVAALKRHQNGHDPFRCVSKARHGAQTSYPILRAANEGLVCPDTACGYKMTAVPERLVR